MSTMSERFAIILCDELNVERYEDLPDVSTMKPDHVFASKAAARLTAVKLIETIRAEIMDHINAAGLEAADAGDEAAENALASLRIQIDAALAEGERG